MKFSLPRLLFRFLFTGAVTGSTVTSYAQQDLNGSVSREIIRRQENLEQGSKLMSEGDKASAVKNYEAAYVAYLDALDKIPAGSATEEEHQAALRKFCDAAMLCARKLIDDGRFSDAERVAKTVLLPQYDPNNQPARQLLANLEQPDYYNKTITPQFAAARDNVVQLLHEADGFVQTGRLDLAMKRYEQVLGIDRYNVAARKGMEEVNAARSSYYNNAYNETRSRMLWLVDRVWERPVHQFGNGRSSTVDAARGEGVRGTEAIVAKLNRIVIPKIDLHDTTVREAIEYLKQQSKNLDISSNNPQEKKGVNIVLKLDALVPATPASNEPAPSPESRAAAAPVGGNADTPITLSLSNVPLIEAIRYLTELAKLKYKIEPYAVSIVPISENTTDLVTKEYRVPPGFIPTASSTTDNAPAAGNQSLNATESHIGKRTNALDYLQEQGISFPAGSFAQYVPAGSKLIVRNTPDAIDLIDTLVDAAVGVQPTQVEIESKFIEITQNNLKELGFDWTLGAFSIGGGTYGSGGTASTANARTTDSSTGATGSSTVSSLNASDYSFVSDGSVVGSNPLTSGLRSGVGNTALNAISANSIDSLISGATSGAAPAVFGLAGVFTNPQFQVVIRALNQKKGIDLMTAPKVTTKSGHKATVRMVREFPYPTEFNPPEPPPPDTSTGTRTIPNGTIVTQGIVTPTTPTSFETRNLGVTLEVEPVIGPDGYTIDLNLSPEVVEFDGFVNYGSPILGAQFNGITIVNNILSPNVINQPIFSTRKVTTSVSIWDGQTVALGGLIREDVQKVEDKVPLLGDIPLAGRLFRSDVDQKIKRNLIIFVTGRLMDAEGKPVRQDEDQEEIVEPLGVPDDLPKPSYSAGAGK